MARAWLPTEASQAKLTDHVIAVQIAFQIDCGIARAGGLSLGLSVMLPPRLTSPSTVVPCTMVTDVARVAGHCDRLNGHAGGGAPGRGGYGRKVTGP